ncbi:Six-hairpin glycosidase-like protein [Rhodanobacter sp. Root480]|uniref:alpha-L-rhamnosidase-related protein n=1 Tax=Rhodanobacter sp. Root480 TaxID=1736542 RepID=UPI000A4DD2E6|nr:Six-hairpin glycosidase-like protein [Rhodanobacter sp. Root480]
MVLATALAMALSGAAAPAADSIEWRQRRASMSIAGDGFVLHAPGGERHIPAQPIATHTASPLFDGLFAMALDDLHKDSVAAIRDDAFDHGQSMPCPCFETGEKWHYVWTRDLSYAVDLGLWRIDPARAKASLLFKLSDVREPAAPPGLYPMQDTGSGGSWPISTDRVVWFLGTRHLLGDPAFADKVYRALTDTLAQDQHYVFDAAMGLYRGETSFLDWREQSYPGWTANDVRFIAQSYALSTNVLYYEALQLAVQMAERHHDPKAVDYRARAGALKAAINTRFWRSDRGLYMSYIGNDGMPIEAYDLLGTSLAITSGVADADRARRALANYPTYPAGSPVIWPERADQPIYHNRAIWPFVSAYALRAARAVNDPGRIAHELRSLLRGAALSGSNMENFELLSQRVHVEDGKLSGPVVNSPRQLWSVGGYLDMVIEGVFGLGADGRIAPKLPASLLPILFGDHERISLQLRDQRITLQRPASVNGNLLVAGDIEQHGNETVVTLKAIHVDTPPLRLDAPLFAPATPAAPQATRAGSDWKVSFSEHGQLYVDGKAVGAIDGQRLVPASTAQQCFSVTRRAGELESLPSPATCVGPAQRLAGTWPRTWTAPAGGRFQATLIYANDHGPINTGITAAVNNLVIACKGAPVQTRPLVMPHSVGMQPSTDVTFDAAAGTPCTFSISQGFNMSFLRRFAHYTGGQGGIEGSLNEARIGDLLVTPLTRATP